MEYSSFNEMMDYYHWDFFVYYILTFIVFINCMKSIIYFYYVKKGRLLKVIASYIDIFISILAGVGLLYGTFFQGILTDIPANNGSQWLSRIFILDIIAFVLFIIQLVSIVKGRTIEKEKSP